MKYTFLSVALATAIGSFAQSGSQPANSLSPTGSAVSVRAAQANDRLNRATEWGKIADLEANKADTAKLVKKTITREFNLPRALDVLIDMSGDLVINTWKENKVKIETTIQHDESIVLTDSQWLERTGISMKVFGSTVNVKSRGSIGISYSGGGVTTTTRTVSGVTYYNNNIFNIVREPVILYIPAESILEIESKSGRLKIKDNIKSLLLDNSDGQIEFANIEKLQVRSNRGSFSGGSVTDADIELSHGRISLKQLNKGIIKSDYSTVEIESLKDVKLNSNNDEMDIDNAASLYGSKNYGNLRINQLTSKLDLQGINSDIKLRHIDPSAQLVKISNRNADLRLSTDKISNFVVDIKGSYNTLYSSFSDNIKMDTMTNAEIESVKALTTIPAQNTKINVATGQVYSQYPGANTISISSSPFSTSGITGAVIKTPWQKQSAKIGNANNPLRYEVVCTSCVIDFK